MSSFELSGLDGGNLLGYLAALGTLRVLTLADPSADVRMEWIDRGAWRPVVHHSGAATNDEFLDLLASRVCGGNSIDAAWRIGDDLVLSCAAFATELQSAVSRADRTTLDFLAAFGSEAYGSGPKRETMSDTGFRTMSGAGHQHFLGFMRELAEGTERDHLRRTLFEAWDYGDGRPSLRWDPADYRPHALRAEDPSGDPIRTMRGANRLAVEAVPLFPCAPVRRRIRTVAFHEGDEGTEVVWPIWTDRLELASVGSLLAARKMERPGVAQVFSAIRFTEGKYRNFTPAKARL